MENVKITKHKKDISPLYSRGISASLPGKWMSREIAVTAQTHSRQNMKKYFFRGFHSSI